MEYTLTSLFFLIIIYLVIRVIKIEGRMKGLQYTVDHLTKNFWIIEQQINAELRTLINEGEEIKAFKKARERLGLSLVEGKEYIEKLMINNG